MLSNDIIREIAVIADHDTTIVLIEVFPWLSDIWQEKCQKLYPDKTYLSSFTAQENFLIKEQTFAITCDVEDDLRMSNILIKYEPLLEEYIKIFEHASNRLMVVIEIDIIKRFAVIYCDGYDGEFSIMFQSDIKNDCLTTIKEDAIKAEHDNNYYIIDMNDFILSNGTKGYAEHIEYQYEYAAKYNDNLS